MIADLVLVGDEAYTREEWARIPHGTISGYIHHGCRCEACRAARRAYYYDREHAKGALP